MLQSQYRSCSRKHALWGQETVLERHPVLLPLLLLLGACVLSSVSFSAENAFPLLTLLGIPSNVLCLSVAFVLGISGSLTTIISIIECIDRRSMHTAMFSEAKEQRLC